METDLQRYLELLPKRREEQLQANPEELKALTEKIEAKDYTIYNDHNVWYTVISENLVYDKYQEFWFESPTFTVDKYFKERKFPVNGGDPQLLVYADYMQVRKRVENLTIKSEKGSQIWEHHFIPSVRKEELPAFKLAKYEKEGKKPDPFDKEKSVFKPWVKDNPQILRNAFKIDTGYWKISEKLIKDPSDFANTIEVVRRNYPKLKVINTIVASEDQFPHVGWIEFGSFIRKCDLLDDHLRSEIVDLNFSLVKAGAPQGASTQQLFRFEFLEMLIRLSRVKYIESKTVDTFHEACQLLFDEIYQNFDMKEWQEFRDNHLWSTPMDQVFKLNHDKLKVVYDKLFPKYNEVGVRSALELMTKQSNVDLSEKEAKYCLGMSKMTVKDEVQNHEEYSKLRFVEFLEYIARVGWAKYPDPNVDLRTKIERVLDDILPVYGLRRTEENDDLDDDNSSEDSVELDQNELDAEIQRKGYKRHLIV